MAKPNFIVIHCPLHGYLRGPFKKTIIHIGSSVIENVVCAFCRECNTYYTTAMAITLGRAEEIDGIPVKRGRSGGTRPPEGFEGTEYDGRPELKNSNPIQSTVEERRANIFRQKEKEQSEKRKTAENKTVQSDLPSAETYTTPIKPTSSLENPKQNNSPKAFNIILTDRNCVNRLICPNCGNQLKIKRYNIPAYDKTERFVSYFVQNLLYCSHCAQTLMTEAVYKDLQKRMSTQSQHIRPTNVRLSYHSHDDMYLYEPVAGFELYFERTANRTSQGNQMTTLAQSSFLADEGYNIHLNNSARREILRSAVDHYGRRRVVDHLRFLISTRMGQRDGRTKFAKAIGIWQDDLNYVVKLK